MKEKEKKERERERERGREREKESEKEREKEREARPLFSNFLTHTMKRWKSGNKDFRANSKLNFRTEGGNKRIKVSAA